MLSSIVPLRAIVLQIVFLLVAIAIEAAVFRRLLNLEPRKSVEYAASINLFCTILGWLALFILFASTSGSLRGADINLLNFIFFDRWSRQTATSLIVVAFLMFFASFAIKQLGLVGVQRLLQPEPKQDDKKEGGPPPSDASSTDTSSDTSENDEVPPPRVIRVHRNEPKTSRRQLQPQLRAVLFANAWSFTAILTLFILRLIIQNTVVS